MRGCWDDVIRYCRNADEEPVGRSPEIRHGRIEERIRHTHNQIHFVIEHEKDLKKVSELLRACNAYLVTVVANDERSREDGCFKIYYIFSPASNDERLWKRPPSSDEERALLSLPESDDDQFLILEYLLQDDDSYPSLRGDFRSVLPFEREICDLYCLFPRTFTPADAAEEMVWAEVCPPVQAGAVLHGGSYPLELAPLRADQRMQNLWHRADAYANAKQIQDADRTAESLGTGQLTVPVGPIHKDVIEAGQFRLQISGEPVDGLRVGLGFKHKGIERLFTTMSLMEGWKLAERVSGDSSFAHSLAYCQAVEELAGVTIGLRILIYRALFLELERIVNHVADIASLAHDVAFNVIASEIAVLRESLMRLNGRLLDEQPGTRLLRGINEPGGIRIACQLTTQAFNSAVEASTRIGKSKCGRFASLSELLEEFVELGHLLLDTRAFMDRSRHVGRLLGPPRRSFEQARQLARADVPDLGQGQDEVALFGATGLIARASGLRRDYRLRHPFGIYRWVRDHEGLERLRESVKTTLKTTLAPPWPQGAQQLETEEMTGDVYSRARIRILEVEQSGKLINRLLLLLDDPTGLQHDEVPEDPRKEIAARLSEVQPYEFALGYVEGWRGDIVYWLMKDRFDRIFRCKVRDPSMLNWQALEVAVSEPKHEAPSTTRRKSRPIMPDFPLINKSFNLSYAGYDL